jgi:aryl-alcohol dehydrogenase-like predicted oxidoreductase
MEINQSKDFSQPVILGRTGLSVGRLGIGASFGVPADAVEMAFERGMNYLYWGSLRKDAMGEGIRHIVARNRERAVIVVNGFVPFGFRYRQIVESSLRKLNIEYIDIFLMAFHPNPPRRSQLDALLKMKREGKIHHLGLSSHNRRLFAKMEAEKIIDVFHVRYSAAHRGAEQDVFPLLPQENGPGIAVFTATRWGKLLQDSWMPPGEPTPTAADCYRFVLSHPSVHVCITGLNSRQQMEHALTVLEKGPLDPDEMAWMHRVGDYIYQKRMKQL